MSAKKKETHRMDCALVLDLNNLSQIFSSVTVVQAHDLQKIFTICPIQMSARIFLPDTSGPDIKSSDGSRKIIKG